MKNDTFHTSILISVDDIEYELDICASVQSDGIGGYEYWGQKCFDLGITSCVEFTWKLLDKVSEEVYGNIESYIDSNYENILEKINFEYSS